MRAMKIFFVDIKGTSASPGKKIKIYEHRFCNFYLWILLFAHFLSHFSIFLPSVVSLSHSLLKAI